MAWANEQLDTQGIEAGAPTEYLFTSLAIIPRTTCAFGMCLSAFAFVD